VGSCILKKIVILISNMHHERNEGALDKHPLTMLAIELGSLKYNVGVLLCDPFAVPSEREEDFFRRSNVELLPMKTCKPNAVSWLTLPYEVFETLRNIPHDLIISEESHGPLALYADFSKDHAPVITFALGGIYKDKLDSSSSFSGVTDVLRAALEDVQMSKSAKLVSNSEDIAELYSSINFAGINWELIPPESGHGINPHSKNIWPGLIDEQLESAEVSTQPHAPKDVSIIIATRDRQTFLPQALHSCLGQTIQPKEIIVVDDGSVAEDQIRNVVELFSDRLNIRLIRNEASIGQAKSRNLGAEVATSAILAFLDDDNYLLENHLESSLGVLQEEDIVASVSFLNLSHSGSPLHKDSKVDSVISYGGDHFGSLNKIYNLACDTHIAIRRDFFLKIGGFPSTYRSSQEDWGLGLAIIASGRKFKSTGTPTILYRVNSDGVWAKGTGVAKWWPIHHTSFAIPAHEWWYDELTRSSVHNQSVILSAGFARRIKYGIFLLKRGQFRTALNGLKRLIRVS